MSSRAIRRLQREEEERKRLESSNASTHDEDEDETDEDEPVQTAKPHKNAFDFLDAEDDDNDEDEDKDREDDSHIQADQDTVDRGPAETAAGSKKSKKKSKKKKKAKKPTTSEPEPEPERQGQLDEIDQALNDLKIKHGDEAPVGRDQELLAFYDLLSVDSKHLNPLNEMKKLFGSAVLEAERPDNVAQRRGRNNQTRDLGTALGRGQGQGLAALALRRNVFITGKADWPKATSGGLGMEIVEEASDFTIEYRFVHSNIYQGTQRQFNLAVESMDPGRMISHLQLNPYHISTLLQVSEIAKQQGDNSIGVGLLERALFTFGRSVHSSFANAMAKGKARLDFRRPENREFWLAAYRYIGALGQKGTWRTAFEWAKLLLSLDPEQDPYSIRLLLDQLAVRGAQFETLAKLAETRIDLIDWGQGLPNVQISLAMAYYKLKQLDKAQDTLRHVVSEHPWVIAELCKQLNMDPIPPAVWGRQPRTQKESLYSSSYGLRAKDIWATPEASSFLKSVLDSATRADPPPASQDAEEKELSFAECRHIMLSENQALLALLPREIAGTQMSVSDPLPPPDDLRSYGEVAPEPTIEDWEQELENNRREEAGLGSWFRGIMSRLGINLGPDQDENDENTVDQVAAALENSDMDLMEVAQRTSRMEELRHRLAIAEQALRQRGINPSPNDHPEPSQAVEEGSAEDDDADMQRALRASMADQRSPGQVEAEESMTARGQNQAFVEEADDDDAPRASSSVAAQPQQPLLREANAPAEPLTQSSTTGGYNDEANQRWLAGRGMLGLKEFISKHGSDENAWKDNLEIDITPATEYAHRITLLKQRTSREFILNYALKQGAGAPASDLIRRLLA